MSVFQSREISIGHLRLGGGQPVRIQSMTNTPTMDTTATGKQIIRLAEAGCELVRVTAANIKEAENLENIIESLHQYGINIPLVADIHFQPKAAETAAKIVEKVRINPGNYSGSYHKAKKYSTADYRNELQKMALNLTPLLNICKEYNTAIRIGINYGSLSDRILYKYGNTAKGMVASAMEFIQICREKHFEMLTLSLKASHVPTMIEANRMMISEMQLHGYNYPLHIGVTEAGNGEEGRIKSAMGIGTLLAEGIGDTIRVSLTEAPENEIPVARRLLEFFGRGGSKSRTMIQYLHAKKLTSTQRNAVAFINETPIFPKENYVLLLSYSGITAEELMLRAPMDFVRAYEDKKADGLLIENGSDNQNFRRLALQIL